MPFHRLSLACVRGCIFSQHATYAELVLAVRSRVRLFCCWSGAFLPVVGAVLVALVFVLVAACARLVLVLAQGSLFLPVHVVLVWAAFQQVFLGTGELLREQRPGATLGPVILVPCQ